MTTLKTQWEMYEQSKVPPNTSKERRQEIKKAFVAGMAVMVNTLEHTPDDSEEFVMSMVDELDDMVLETGYA